MAVIAAMPWSCATGRTRGTDEESMSSGTATQTSVARSRTSRSSRCRRRNGVCQSGSVHEVPTVPRDHVKRTTWSSVTVTVSTTTGGPDSGRSTDPSLEPRLTFRARSLTEIDRNFLTSASGTSNLARRRKLRSRSSMLAAKGAIWSAGAPLDPAPHQAMPCAGLPMSSDRSMAIGRPWISTRGSTWSPVPRRVMSKVR